MTTYHFHYGKQHRVAIDLDQAQVVWQQFGPQACSDPASAIRDVLAQPLHYPSVDQAVVPGDRIVCVIDPDVPRWSEIIEQLGESLEQRGIAQDDFHIVFNQSAPEIPVESPIKYQILSRDQVLSGRSVYLASTAQGERVYFPEEIGEADYIITIGRFGFDESWGYRGTHSSVYPSLAAERSPELPSGQMHLELTPEHSNGMRQQIDEIGWLLGLQFSIQVIPAASGELAQIIAGASDEVYRESITRLHDAWRSPAEVKAETVVISVPDFPGTNSWSAVARACAVAEKLGTPDARVILLTGLQSFPEALLREMEGTSELDQVIRILNQSDSLESRSVAALARLSSRFRVYLLSQLEQDIVESLYMIPLSDESELKRAVQGGSQFGLLDAGQFAYVDSTT